MDWIGTYIAEKYAGRNATIVHLGDHWDMPSLSSYDKGKKSMEGRRFIEDVLAGNRAFELLDTPVAAVDGWSPRKVLLRGNHEDRINRATELDAQLDGLVSLDQLDSKDWEVHDYLAPVTIDGVVYSHVFVNPMTGRPLTGTAANRLKTIGHSFTMGHQQTLDYTTRFLSNGQQQCGLVAGACLTPDHRVLTSDLRYVELADIGVGDQLVSFDEFPTKKSAPRRYRTGTVRAVRTTPAEVFAVTLSNGKVFKVTGDHLWLTRCGGQTSVREGGTYQWRTTDSMRKGTVIPQVLDEWEHRNPSHAHGYLSGMFDGAGCYYLRETTGGTIGQLSLSQKKGAVLDKTISLLDQVLGLDCLSHHNDNRGISSIRIKGGLRGIARVLGEIRPVRLLEKFRAEDLGNMHTTTNHKVVSIEPLGTMDVVQVDVDHGTMIVEGYPHHNCYQHDEDYKGPQGNAHWRGIIVCHNVVDGGYDPLFIQLDYLSRRYAGHPLAEHRGREL